MPKMSRRFLTCRFSPAPIPLFAEHWPSDLTGRMGAKSSGQWGGAGQTPGQPRGSHPSPSSERA